MGEMPARLPPSPEVFGGRCSQKLSRHGQAYRPVRCEKSTALGNARHAAERWALTHRSGDLGFCELEQATEHKHVERMSLRLSPAFRLPL